MRQAAKNGKDKSLPSDPTTLARDDERRIDADRLDLLLIQTQSVVIANTVNPLVLWWIAGQGAVRLWASWSLAQAVLSWFRWRARRNLRRRLQEGEVRPVSIAASL